MLLSPPSLMRHSYSRRLFDVVIEGSSPRSMRDSSSSGEKSRAAPLIEYRFPVFNAAEPGKEAPSLKRSPSREPQVEQRTVTPAIDSAVSANSQFLLLLLSISTALLSTAEAKDGQPVRASNFALE